MILKGLCVNKPYLYSRTWTQMKQWNKINMKLCWRLAVALICALDLCFVAHLLHGISLNGLYISGVWNFIIHWMQWGCCLKLHLDCLCSFTANPCSILSKLWSFSIALDSSTHQGMSYLDMRIWFHWKGSIWNFHLMAIPLFEHHTGENMFSVLQSCMDAIFMRSWTKKCIFVLSNKARNMTGSSQGLVTRISSACSPGLIRIWCSLHQLDLVMQKVFKPAFKDKFYSTLTSLVGYLRRQQNLVAEMRSTWPKVATTRWISMYSTTQWLIRHQAQIMQ